MENNEEKEQSIDIFENAQQWWDEHTQLYVVHKEDARQCSIQYANYILSSKKLVERQAVVEMIEQELELNPQFHTNIILTDLINKIKEI